jgi:hypothetical protein
MKTTEFLNCHFPEGAVTLRRQCLAVLLVETVLQCDPRSPPLYLSELSSVHPAKEGSTCAHCDDIEQGKTDAESIGETCSRLASY